MDYIIFFLILQKWDFLDLAFPQNQMVKSV